MPFRSAICYYLSASKAGLHIYLSFGLRDIRDAGNLYWHRAVASSEDTFFLAALGVEISPVKFFKQVLRKIGSELSNSSGW